MKNTGNGISKTLNLKFSGGVGHQPPRLKCLWLTLLPVRTPLKSHATPLVLQIKSSCTMQGWSQAAPLRQSRTAIGIVPLKTAKGTIIFVPFKI